MNTNSKILEGRICLVTGATAGIGQVTATALAAQGAELVIAGRNPEKAEKIVKQIKTQTGNPNVTALLADFSDLDQVRQLAVEFKQRHTQLHVLVNNAGAFFNARQRTKYGVERTFLVNHLAPFLLTNLLLDLIKASAPARIINVSSDAHRSGRLNFNDLEFNRFYFGMFAYGRSKLANVLFTNELANRLAGERRDGQCPPSWAHRHRHLAHRLRRLRPAAQVADGQDRPYPRARCRQLDLPGLLPGG